MPDAQLLTSTPDASWLPNGGTAEVWAGADCQVPDPCIIVRLLAVRRTPDAHTFFVVPTAKGLDLPTLFLGRGEDKLSVADGLEGLRVSTFASSSIVETCVGYVRNIVPSGSLDYPHPMPFAHVPVFRMTDDAEPVADGAWIDLEAARRDLSSRHWWPIVNHALTN